MILKSIVANTPPRFSTLPRPRLQLCGFLATNKFLYDYDIKKPGTAKYRAQTTESHHYFSRTGKSAL